jgi:transcriptional regulator with XRE-family HTH domain
MIRKSQKRYNLLLNSPPAEISRVIKRDISQVSKWFSGKLSPTYRTCAHIAKCYGINPSEVMEIIGKRTAGGEDSPTDS